MTSVEHKLAVHRIVAERRAEGKPVWAETLPIGNLFRGSELPFEEQRDMFARIVKRSRWFNAEDEDSELHSVLEEFGDTQTVDEAILLLHEIYDEADCARVTFRR